jgi:RHS repeat-associated protein
MNPRYRAALGALALAAVLSPAGPAVAQVQHPRHARGVVPGQMLPTGDVDVVNVFNGGLTLSIPIGRTYPVSAALSYGLRLAYTSKVWDFVTRVNAGRTYTEAVPGRRSDAGLGWQLSLGRLLPPYHALNNSADWIYVASDTSEHILYPTLHNGDVTVPGVLYTRDGSYLRAKAGPGGAWELEFPDGPVHSFDASGRVTSLRDRFTGRVDVTYFANRWELRDSHGRLHTVYLATLNAGGTSYVVVDAVDLAAFGSLPPARYDFVYQVRSIRRSCDDNYPYSSDFVSVPVLSQVVLPDGASRWLADYYQANDPVGCSQGAIASLTLPTLGRIRWTYRNYNIPADGCRATEWARYAPGVATRTLYDAAGATSGTWTYETSLSQPPTSGPLCDDGSSLLQPPEELQNTVITPLGDRTTHFFSVWPRFENSNLGFRRGEYGLPLSRRSADASGTRFLSREVQECDAAGADCVAQRRVFARYETEPAWPGPTPGPCSPTGLYPACFDTNRRVASLRTNYLDDLLPDGTAVYAVVNHSDFDGLGHYRTSKTNGNFPLGRNARTTTTLYNPGAGTYGTASFAMPSAQSPWVLGTYTQQSVTEGGRTATARFCFDPANGFLQRKRVLSTSDASAPDSANDVLVAHARDAAGNLTEEAYYGADATPGLPSGELCALGLPARQYRLRHAYQYGSLAGSQFYAGAAPLSFKLVDQEIDAQTGLVARSRGTDGLATDFTYDALGRLTRIDPAEAAQVALAYTPATSATAPARVTVTRLSAGGGTLLAESETVFDAQGRTWLEKTRYPQGWSTRETRYNAMGFVDTVSTDDAQPTYVTRFMDYDAFGRARRVRPPDGGAHDMKLAYTGVRLVTRTLEVGTRRNAGGTIVETQEQTIEERDRQGRVVARRESSGAGGAQVESAYAHHLVGGLASSTTSAQVDGASVTQTRAWTYDNRGFLLSETHPESGTTTYSAYDARGHYGRVQRAGSDLRLVYDPAERPLQVADYADPAKVYKQFAYGTAGRANGKLESATRRNDVFLGAWPAAGSPTADPATILITEGYTYGGKQGAVSARSLSSTVNGAPGPAFVQGFTWSDLGDPAGLSYPTCTHAGCLEDPGMPAARSVSYTYTRGFLTGVAGYANAISYHLNGTLDAVAHSNGVTVTHGRDPHGLPRPASIATSGVAAAQNWSTGSYAYDGSGNVVGIGAAWFTYDGVERLTQASLGLGLAGGGGTTVTQTYAYDAFGNLRSYAGTRSLTIPTDAATNRLTGAQVSYDGRGNLLAWNGNRYAYGPLDDVWRVRSGAQDWAYAYTVDGERVAAYDVNAGGSRWRWTLRGLRGELLREYANDAGVWTVRRDYVYRGRNPIAAETPSGRRHFHLDHLGTPRLVTRQDGSLDAYHVYYPYGEEATPASPQRDERVRFHGHERDLHDLGGAADDLDYLHARYSNPTLGRFLSVDPLDSPLASPQSGNRYAFTAGNPLKYVDPTGLVLDFGFGDTLTVLAQAPLPVFSATITVKPRSSSPSLVDRTASGVRRGVADLADDLRMLLELRSSDFSLDRAAHLTGSGLLAYVDGLVPLVDPLAALDAYDPDEVGMEAVSFVGDNVLSVLSGGSGAAGKAALKATASGTKRVSGRTLRRALEKRLGRKLPKGWHIHHKQPLADGGTNAAENLTALPPWEHIDWHRLQGDFSRWGGGR